MNLNEILPILEQTGFTYNYQNAVTPIILARYKHLFLTITTGRIHSRFYLENSKNLPVKFPGFKDIIIDPNKITAQLTWLIDHYNRIVELYESSIKMDVEIEINRERMIVLGLIDHAEASGITNHATNLYNGVQSQGVNNLNKTEQVLSAFKVTSAGVPTGPNHPVAQQYIESMSRGDDNPAKMHADIAAHHKEQDKLHRGLHVLKQKKNPEKAAKHLSYAQQHNDLYKAHQAMADRLNSRPKN